MRRAKWSTPIKYCDDHVDSYRLLILSGDIELNPGPPPRCQKCDKTMSHNQIIHRSRTSSEISHAKCISNVRHQGPQQFYKRNNCVIRGLSSFNVKLEQLNTTSIEYIVKN